MELLDFVYFDEPVPPPDQLRVPPGCGLAIVARDRSPTPHASASDDWASLSPLLRDSPVLGQTSRANQQAPRKLYIFNVLPAYASCSFCLTCVPFLSSMVSNM